LLNSLNNFRKKNEGTKAFGALFIKHLPIDVVIDTCKVIVFLSELKLEVKLGFS
jgi:hypothetical protein